MITFWIILWGVLNVAANLLAAWWIMDAGCRQCRYQWVYTLGASILLLIALRRIISTLDALFPGAGLHLAEIERYLMPALLSGTYLLLAHEVRRIVRIHDAVSARQGGGEESHGE